ncbi:G-protein coupled receptor 157-like [Mytilus californianus]|uniref:G-protein coupled receptor 157-like n=1 Tax=Mytilus californianus TaxID=6549 RepID=UPI0022456E28|nr:G-protein coupled receptor 157-like [Mytilus californianus]
MGNNTDPGEYIDKINMSDIVLTLTGASLSIVGAFVLFFAHYLRHKSGKPVDEVRQFLIFLTIADMFNAIGLLSGVARFLNSEDFTEDKVAACHRHEEFGCIVQSYVTALFSMSSFFWTTIIAFHLFWTNEDNSPSSFKKTILYHFITWGIPFAITTAAVSKNVLGSDLSAGSGAWCWISACLPHYDRTLWMTISGKGWEILMYFSCCAFYLLIKWRKIQIRRHRTKVNIGLSPRQTAVQSVEETKPHEDLRFLLLWLIEVALRIFGTVRYLTAAVRRHTTKELKSYNSVDHVFLHFQSFGDSAQALCSCLLFCIFDNEMRNLLKDKLCCSQKRSEKRPLLTRQTTTC